MIWMTDLVIGIDPGLTGALAILAGEEIVALEDLPVARSPGKLAWIDGAKLEAMLEPRVNGHSAAVVIELVHSMPKQGVASSFTFGATYGSILSIVQAQHLPLHLISPSQWKREMKLQGKDKRAALAQARLLFPTADLALAKHHGRAEALLLAYWFREAKKTTPEGG